MAAEIKKAIIIGRKATFTNSPTNAKVHRSTKDMMHAGLNSGTNTMGQSRGAPSTAGMLQDNCAR